MTILDIISSHPSTARFIAKKLCTWFLGYNPPEGVIESVKQTYLTSEPLGDIKSMLRVILNENVISYLATPKIKRPVHLAAVFLPSFAPRMRMSSIQDTSICPCFRWATFRILTGETLFEQDVADLQAFYDTVGPSSFAARDVFGLAGSLPGFQWY